MKSLCVDELIIGNKDGQHLCLTAEKIAAFDTNGCQRFLLFIERGGSPALELCDGNGTARLHAGLNEYGCPSLTLRDGNHTGRLELELGEDEGDPSLILLDRSGHRSFVLGPIWQGHHTISLRSADKDGKLVPWVPTSDDTKE